MARLVWPGFTMLLVLASVGCEHESTAPSPPPRVPVGLTWGSGASGAFVEDTVPLVVFYRDSVGDPIALPRPTLTWASSNPTVLEIVTDTTAIARGTGSVVLTAVSQAPSAFTLDVPFEIIPVWHGRLVWARQPDLYAQPSLAVQELPSHDVLQVPGVGYPDAGSGDPYLTSDGRFAATTGTRPTSPVARRTIFVVDLVTGDVQMPLDALPGNQFSPAWFPGDTLLVFLMEAVTGYEIFTARPDGSDVQQRTQLGQFIPPFFDVTPEGTIVLELHAGWNSSDLFEVTLAGDVLRRLTATPSAYNTTPAVSPDGTLIAYTSDAGPSFGVWVMNRDGSGAHQLLPERRTITGIVPDLIGVVPTPSTSPSWTPDSRYVLLGWYIDPYIIYEDMYVSTHFNTLGDLYAVRLADGLAIPLTHTPLIDGQPVFR